MHGHLLTKYLDITADHLVQLTKRILTLASQLVYFGMGPPKYRNRHRRHGSSSKHDQQDLFAISKPAVAFLSDMTGILYEVHARLQNGGLWHPLLHLNVPFAFFFCSGELAIG